MPQYTRSRAVATSATVALSWPSVTEVIPARSDGTGRGSEAARPYREACNSAESELEVLKNVSGKFAIENPPIRANLRKTYGGGR